MVSQLNQDDICFKDSKSDWAVLFVADDSETA